MATELEEGQVGANSTDDRHLVLMGVARNCGCGFGFDVEEEEAVVAVAA